MALKKGICKNYGECELADNKVVQEVEKSNFVCENEECGMPLYEIESGTKVGDRGTKPGKNWKLLGIISGVVVVVLIGIIAFFSKGISMEFFKESENVDSIAKSVPMTLTLNHTEKTLHVGQTDTLVAILSPENTSAKLQWKASNTSKAIEVNNGIVTAKEEGTSRVQVKAIVGNDTLTAICAYTVKGPGKESPGKGGSGKEEPRSIFGGKADYYKDAKVIKVKRTLELTDSEGREITLHAGDEIRGVGVKNGNILTVGECVVDGESSLFTGEMPF